MCGYSSGFLPLGESEWQTGSGLHQDKSPVIGSAAETRFVY
jgi:hypothetical protein